jgi:hypothetical protein
MSATSVHVAALVAFVSVACSSSDRAHRTPDGGAGASDAASAGSGGATWNRGADAGGRRPSGGATSDGDAASGGAPGSSSGGEANGSGGDSGGTGGASSDDAGTTVQGGPRVSDFVGVNAFIDDDVTKLAALGNVREYHQWVWNDGNGEMGYAGYPKNELQFSLWNGFWDFDAFYTKLTQASVMVFPCIQGSVDYLNGAMPPVASGADVTSPMSYAAHASFLYQYAARYGTVAVVASNLKLAAGQKMSSGLGLLPYYENGNEPDATWVKPDGSFLFTPEATAAMTSADYDGHRGALGAGAGIKAADPKAKLVLAGLAGAGKSDWVTNVTSYLDGMRAWADRERGGSFPADVINVHEYCFGPDPFGTANPRPGISPEDCKLGELLGEIAQYRDAKLPGKEVWLTEFGYDTHPRSRLRAPSIGGATAEAVQGQWLVRSILALLASGIDRAFVYISRDDCTGTDSACPDNAVQFATSGVLTQKGDESPKAAWYFLSTFRTRLGPMRYLDTAKGHGGVLVARFYDVAQRKGAYVVWMPTSNGSAVKGFSLSVTTGTKSASVVTLEDGQANGRATTVSSAGGAVTLEVTETPTLVLVDGMP